MSASTVSRVSPLEERISDVIRRRLDDKGATVADVAEWTGVGHLRIQSRLDYRQPWLISEVYLVALFLGTSVSVLIREASED